MTRTNKSLFSVVVVINSLLVIASTLLYIKYSQLSNYRSTAVNVGHSLIELRDRVTQHALDPSQEPYQLAASTVEIENQVELMVDSYQTPIFDAIGFGNDDAYNTLKDFRSSALKITDAIDHIIGLIVVKKSVLTSLTQQIYGTSNSINNVPLADGTQKNVLIQAIKSDNLSHEILTNKKLAPILKTFKDVEKQKQQLFAFLLSPAITEFVNHSEDTMAQLSGDVRLTLIQLFAAICTLIAGFVASLYLLRMKELKRNNRAYQESIDRVEKANHAKSLFLATMSHELRTPMNGVLGMAQIIKDESSEDKTKENIQVIIDSGQHLVTLLNDILDFSKIEQGKMVLENTAFSIDDTLTHSNQVLKPLASKKGIDLITSNLTPHDVRFIGDSARLRQILFNIAGNAIKFTNEGQVELRFILCKTPHTHLEISISDTGIGIARDKLDNIFTPFEQAELSTTRKFGGTGLGLSIVKQITDLIGGDISVSSEPNVGTTFTLSLPLAIEMNEIPCEESKDKPAPSEITQNSPSLNVLLVEDNQVNAAVAQDFLSSHSTMLYGYVTEWQRCKS